MTDVNNVTVADLDALTDEIFKKRVEIDAHAEVGKALNKDLVALKEKMVVFLKELNRDNYKTPHGTVSILQRWRVGLPQTLEDKKALFGWLQEKGIFDEYVSVNSQSLNSLYMGEWDEAKKRGEGMTFKIPGVGDPKLFEDLGMRKK